MHYSKIRVFLVLFLTAFSLSAFSGCGSSNDDFMFVNNNNGGAANSGDLVFRFQRPLAQTIVDPTTTTLRFDFYSTNPPTDTSLEFSESRLYADVITFTKVRNNIVFVEVTMFNQDGVPFSRYSAPVQVPSSGEVDLGTPTVISLESIKVNPNPVNLVITNILSNNFVPLSITGTFEGVDIALPINPDSVTFEVDDNRLTDVDENGIAFSNAAALFFFGGPSGEIALNTTATATYTLNGVSHQDRFRLDTYIFGSELTLFTPLEFEEGAFPVDPSGTFDDWHLFLIRPDGTQFEIPDSDLIFALESPTPNVSLGTNGVLELNGAQIGQQFTVIISYLDDGPGGSGLTFTTRAKFVVDDEN